MKNVGWIQLRIVRIFNRGPIRFNTTWDSYIIIFESMWEYSTFIASRERLFVDYLKGIVPPKCKFLHHLLTLLFQICRIYLFLQNTKYIMKNVLWRKFFLSTQLKSKGSNVDTVGRHRLWLYGQKRFFNISSVLHREKMKLHRFGTTWRWVNEDTISFLWVN